MRIALAVVSFVGLGGCDLVFPVGGGGGDGGHDGPPAGDSAAADASSDAPPGSADAAIDAAAPTSCSAVPGARFCADFDSAATGLGQLTLGATTGATMIEVGGGLTGSCAQANLPINSDPGYAGGTTLVSSTPFVGEVWMYSWVTAQVGCEPYVLWLDFDPSLQRRILVQAETGGFRFHLQYLDGGSNPAEQTAFFGATTEAWNLIHLVIDTPNGQVTVDLNNSGATVLSDPDFAAAAVVAPWMSVGAATGGNAVDCTAWADDLVVL